MKSNLLASCVSLSLLAVGGAAWGNVGHQTIGFIAQNFLGPKAAAFVQGHLNASFDGSLGIAATWADQVKSTPPFEWSKNLHFVDAEDDPPVSCSVEETRDCADFICILAAIANYTARVVDPTLPPEQTMEALLFIDHFLGDITQPLHVEAIAAGGNDIDALCSGESTNLHAAWDTGMLVKNVDAVHGGTSEQYAADLTIEIINGTFSGIRSEWITCINTTEPFFNKRADMPSIERDIANIIQGRQFFNDSTITPLECPLVWARDTNAFDCSTVFSFEPETDPELCEGTYFTNAIPVIDLQLSKAGFRLAAWLNVLFDGAPLVS
ncbi:hypothetical protein NM688_g8151 [Phlebia brevispora]|uniref:Uncharacterized protein n=1 Tax=Phlebia brevispora TaxID=194682 RepID=A0ACC1RWU4_9APHY|nr:hypothetical protein NM688_g8151 [Phlebia brevispora]